MLPSALSDQYLDACTGGNRPSVPAESAVYISKLEDKPHHPFHMVVIPRKFLSYSCE